MFWKQSTKSKDGTKSPTSSSPVLISGHDDLKKQFGVYVTICSTMIVMPAIFAMAFFSYRVVSYTIMISWVIVLLSSSKIWQRLSQVKSGYDGECAVRERLLSLLGDGDTLFSPLLIKHNGKDVQIDNLAVTDGTVFICEVKTMHGKMEGKDRDDFWYYKKTTGNALFGVKIKNPAKQVIRQQKVVRSILSDLKTNLDVVACVVLTEPTQVEYTGSIPFIDIGDIDEFIDKNRNTRGIGDKNALVSFLINNAKRSAQ